MREDEGQRGGGVQLRPLVPRPGHLDGQPEGLILSVWTDPAHRRRGLATRIVRAILDWCRTQGVTRVTLHASEEGRAIYERLGFRQTNEMRLDDRKDMPTAPTTCPSSGRRD